jgi:hypothetical protein
LGVFEPNHDEVLNFGLAIISTSPHVYSISFNGSLLAIGINNSPIEGFTNAGEALVYKIDNGLLLYRHIYDPTPGNGGGFGYAVALSGFNLLTTAYASKEAQFLNIE